MNKNICALKQSCRKAERKTKLEANHSILKEKNATYNKTVRTERQIYFFKIKLRTVATLESYSQPSIGC